MTKALKSKIDFLEKENASLKLQLLENEAQKKIHNDWSQCILEGLANPIFVKDENHKFVTFNKSFTELLGTTREELVGKSDFDFTSQEESKIFWKTDSEVLANGITNWNEETHTTNGIEKAILTSKARIQDAAGKYYIIGVVTDITDNKNQQTVLMKKNSEIEQQKSNVQSLLKEVHHRVKNNLQIVNSLLNLQLSKFDNPQLKTLVENSKNRIFSMAKIHEILCESEHLSAINFNDYVRALIKNLILSKDPDKDIQIRINIPNLLLNIETSIPLGLILNEIITNSIKYGKNEKEDFTIYLDFTKNNNFCILNVGDNGTGTLQADFKPSLGSELIGIFCEQLDADLNIPHDKEGVHYSISFPI